MSGEMTTQVYWSTSYIKLQATQVTIETAGKTFYANVADKRLSSDTGGIVKRQLGVSRYTTLEIEWVENGVKMRLNLYFEANNTHWWVYEIRTYDGTEEANWIYYTDNSPYFRTPVGQSFVDDIQLQSDPLNTTNATLTFKELQLSTIF